MICPKCELPHIQNYLNDPHPTCACEPPECPKCGLKGLNDTRRTKEYCQCETEPPLGDVGQFYMDMHAKPEPPRAPTNDEYEAMVDKTQARGREFDLRRVYISEYTNKDGLQFYGKSGVDELIAAYERVCRERDEAIRFTDVVQELERMNEDGYEKRIKELEAELASVRAKLKESEEAYEYLWKMRIQDEMERKKK